MALGRTWSTRVADGPNPNLCYAYRPAGDPTCMPANEYNPQLTKASLQSFPIASVTTPAQLQATDF